MHSPKRTRLILPLQPVTTQGECPIRIMIEKLSDEVLLSIFRYYLDASPRFWIRVVLVHICRKWRRIVFASSQALRLRLFYTHGSPFLKALNHWPSLPIVVEYGGSLELDPPAPEDDDNIMAALEQSDRVSSISLTVTYSLLKKLYAIESPFSELEHLVLLSRDEDWQQLTLPSIFGRSTRLRSLHLTGIAFSALPRLLYSSRDLVDLQLHQDFTINPWLASPEALTDALSGMAQLRSLSLHLPFTIRGIGDPLPSKKRVILPALTHLNFLGRDEYLEDLVSGIDAPRLGDIEVTFTNKYRGELLDLSRFIDRILVPKSCRKAHILFSDGVVSISLTQPGALTYLTLQIFCDEEDYGQLSMSHICAQLSESSLSNVEDLRISAMLRQTRRKYEEFKWPPLVDPKKKGPPVDMVILDSFTGVKLLHIAAGGSPTDIAYAIQLLTQEPWRGNVLPALHKLYIADPGPRHAPLRETVVSFMISRRLSGHPIEVEYDSLYHIIGPFSPSQQVMLSDDILLNIFRYYMDPIPQTWPTLTWVCQRWRQLVRTSPLGLDLRLYCTHGTPVSKTLDCWPALPIVIKYGGF
ncbi:hypothetical protein EDB84DRAFT_1581626, partial [Lactarius hengduanensis]